MMANPFHAEIEMIFTAAFRHEVKNHIGNDERVEAPAIGGVGVEDVAVFVFVKDAEAGRFLAWKFLKRVIVIHFALRFFLSERNVKITIEIGAIGGDPRELPAHALFEWDDFGQWSA